MCRHPHFAYGRLLWPLRPRLILTLILPALTFATNTFAQPESTPPSGEELLSILKAKDEEFLREFTLEGHVTYPHQMRSSSPLVGLRAHKITRSGDTTASESKVVDKSGLLGRPFRLVADKLLANRPPTDLNAWVIGNEMVLDDTKLLEAFSRSITMVIHPGRAIDVGGNDKTGELSLGFPMAIVAHSDPEGPKRTFEHDITIFAMGRGYSKFLTSIDQVENLPNGLLRCKASGLTRGSPSHWDLVIDLNADYLVREAVGTTQDNGFVYLSTQNSGVKRFGEIALPEKGVFYSAYPSTTPNVDKYHRYEVTFDSYSKVADKELIDRVSQILHSDFPNGTIKYDYRNGDSPRFETVGEAEMQAQRQIEISRRQMWETWGPWLIVLSGLLIAAIYFAVVQSKARKNP